MTKRYPFRRPFCSRNPRNPRHFQRIPLWILQPSDGAHHPRLHLYEPSRLRRPCRHRLRRHVYHAHFTPVPVMRKLCHLAPRPHPSAAAPIPSPPPQSCPGPRAPPKNNSPLPAPQCLPIPAISKPSLQAPLRATLPAPAESVPTPVSHSALLPAAARFPLPPPRPGPPHFPTQPAHPRQSALALPAKHCCCFESEMPPAPPRPVQPHPPSTRSPHAASSRIAIPPRRLAPPAPVPRSPSASRV